MRSVNAYPSDRTEAFRSAHIIDLKDVVGEHVNVVGLYSLISSAPPPPRHHDVHLRIDATVQPLRPSTDMKLFSAIGSLSPTHCSQPETTPSSIRRSATTSITVPCAGNSSGNVVNQALIAHV